jgi:hypothetical protein
MDSSARSIVEDFKLWQWPEDVRVRFDRQPVGRGPEPARGFAETPTPPPAPYWAGRDNPKPDTTYLACGPVAGDHDCRWAYAAEWGPGVLLAAAPEGCEDVETVRGLLGDVGYA